MRSVELLDVERCGHKLGGLRVAENESASAGSELKLGGSDRRAELAQRTELQFDFGIQVIGSGLQGDLVL